ncbi:MAG: polysaccharide biosynthesis tyrosine autokinase [Candidatus Omnitrophica bacterium]|nr:polysaccharide biosynthesis tyrosine autokinase [Candidatus Omnitrophota bacterium]
MQPYKHETHLSDYLHIIKSRKGVVITFFFLIVFLVTLGSFLMEPVYRATVTLFVDIESPNVLTATDSVALGTTNYYTYKEYFQSQKELIKNRTIARQVFDELDLKENPAYISEEYPMQKLLDRIGKVFGLDQNRKYIAFKYSVRDISRNIQEQLSYGKAGKPEKDKDYIKEFLEKVHVEPVRDTRLLLLNVDDTDPELAADIANEMAEIYVSRNLAYITKSELMNLHKNEYLRLQAKLSEYSKVYKHKHPKMIRLKQEIAQMEGRISKEKEIADKYDLGNFYTTDITLTGSSSILAGFKANNITIQDSAEVPIIPIKPKKRLNILLAVIVGIFGGIGLAFFFDYLDNTVKSSEDIERLVGWPFLGSIPKMRKRTKIKDLFVQFYPQDPVAEAYRTVRTSVVFSATEEHPLKSIIVTSPGPQEGKTVTLCNLGIAMAQSNNRVLLVDADMRKSRLHYAFRKTNKTGLSSFLSGQADFDDIVLETNVENLYLAPAGPHPPDPSELLSSHKMLEFIDSAKERFDFILFDTAPMAVVTDAVILSKIVDGTILVLESGKTTKKMLPRMNQLLMDAHARIIGALLNRITIAGANYQYYARYYGRKK